MKNTLLTLLMSAVTQVLLAQADSVATSAAAPSEQTLNKAVALQFYQDLWFTNHTERYKDYVAEEYEVFDIDEDAFGTKEKAISQKEVADFFWANGQMSGEIDYQVAEGNRVVTRWYWTYEPTTMLGRFLVGSKTIPIINVFHFKEGKIIRTDNHRHDISMNRTNTFVIKGLLFGLLIALVPTIIAFRLKRKLRRVTTKN